MITSGFGGFVGNEARSFKKLCPSLEKKEKRVKTLIENQ